MSKPFYEKTKREKRDVEDPALAYAFKRGWTNIKINTLTANGYPDRLFWRRGRYVWWEFKRPGSEPEEHQVFIHDQLRNSGCEVYWTDDIGLADFKRIMR